MLLVLAGPSASGKSTLCDRLVNADMGFSRVVTTTTRAPREGEVDGQHYRFFTPAEFEARVAAGDFLEWAWVHGERRYGTLAASVLEPLSRGSDLVMSVDVQGVDSFRRAAAANPLIGGALHTVFIVVDYDTLLARLRGRGDDEAEIARRMTTAQAELREAPKFEYVIESGTRDEDFGRLLSIVGRIRRRAEAGRTSC
jgi:guanylate kinase